MDTIKISDGGWLSGQSGGCFLGKEGWHVYDRNGNIKIYYGSLIHYMPDYISTKYFTTLN